MYGLARTFLAVQAALMLAVNPASTLFSPAVGIANPPTCASLASASIYCLVPDGSLDLARWISVVILLVVASGWRPRITGVLHWWVSYSFVSTGVLVSGGEAITSILTLLLIPMTLTDPRRWHWDTLPDDAWTSISVYQRFIGWTTYLLLRVQIAAIYFHSAIGKVPVEQWSNGTAIYYWLIDPSFGMPPWLEPVLMPLLTSGVVVTAITWGTVLLEFCLFAGLFMDKRAWPYFMWMGIGLHSGIAVLHGLPAFSLAMIGALILFLRPLGRPFPIHQMVDRGSKWLTRFRRKKAPAA